MDVIERHSWYKKIPLLMRGCVLSTGAWLESLAPPPSARKPTRKKGKGTSPRGPGPHPWSMPPYSGAWRTSRVGCTILRTGLTSAISRRGESFFAQAPVGVCISSQMITVSATAQGGLGGIIRSFGSVKKLGLRLRSRFSRLLWVLPSCRCRFGRFAD